MRNRTFWRGPVAGLALCILSGCAYQLGSALPPGLETVHVPTVINKTNEPLLENEVTRALVREFQRDGTLRIADADTANARLDVTLVGFQLEPLRYERNSSKTATEYRLWIDADIVLTMAKADKPMMSRHVRGKATFIFLGDMATSKAQALPDTARDLAHNIVETMVEYW